MRQSGMDFERLCEEGTRADALLAAGDFSAAVSAYQAVVDDMLAAGGIDAFIASKATLGLLLSLIGLDREPDAHAIWVQTIEDGAVGIGIYGLENGQTSVHDLLVYFLISAHLHSLGTDPDQALAGVDDFMVRSCEVARENDPSLLPLIASNWACHLAEIHEPSPAPEHAPLEALRAEIGMTPPLRPAQFPPPYPWVIDWLDDDDNVTAFLPDGSVVTGPPDAVTAAAPAQKKGFLSRLFGKD